MDEKLRKKLCDFLQCECDYGETHCASIDYLEQAFRDAHWIEPQQPEELVKSDIYRHSCITPYPALVMAKCHACVWDEATLAQHTLDLKTMVKLPSEDELALWLCDHLSYTSRELAYELLRLLGGKK